MFLHSDVPPDVAVTNWRQMAQPRRAGVLLGALPTIVSGRSNYPQRSRSPLVPLSGFDNACLTSSPGSQMHTISLLAVCGVLSLGLAACNESDARGSTGSYNTSQSSIGGDYRLTLVFACAAGCGWPEQVTIETRYTYEQCQAAGAQWLSPQANPTGALSDFQCNLAGVS
jgi:hypothetical protein